MEDPPPSWHEIHELTRRLDSEAPRERKAAAEALASCGERGLEPLCRALRDEDEQVRAAVAQALVKLGPPALQRLVLRLKSGASRVSCRAAWALGSWGPAGLEPLAWACDSRDKNLRRSAVEGLQRMALPECTLLLCRMLEDRQPEVRLAAARALGEIGDERAIRPLCQAMRARAVGGSTGMQLVCGALVLLLGVAMFSGVLYYSLTIRLGGGVGAIGVIIQAFLHYFVDRRAQGEFSRAITEALLRIGERRPSLELRNVLPDLRLLAVDRLQQDPPTRNASREAVCRIEALTEALKSLPLPAETSPDPDVLPRVGAAPAPAERSLPRVR